MLWGGGGEYMRGPWVLWDTRCSNFFITSNNPHCICSHYTNNKVPFSTSPTIQSLVHMNCFMTPSPRSLPIVLFSPIKLLVFYTARPPPSPSPLTPNLPFTLPVPNNGLPGKTFVVDVSKFVVRDNFATFLQSQIHYDPKRKHEKLI